MRFCGRCKVSKLETEFGSHSWCRECYREYSRNYRAGKKAPLSSAPVKKEEDFVPPSSTDSTSFEVDGNQATLTSSYSGPKTLDELLDTCKVDTSVWAVDHHVVNTWTLGNGGIAYQVKAWLNRIHVQALEFPEIAPVSLSTQFSRVVTPSTKSVKKALIIPDSQNGYLRDPKSGKLDPFHDRRAWNVALQIAIEERPDTIVLLGDMLDLPEWTDKYFRSPDMYWTTQPALLELSWWISKFRMELPEAEIHYIEGNHEARMWKAIGCNLMAAWQLKRHPDEAPVMSVPFLLDLDSMGVQYHGSYPDGEVWLNDNLCCVHGDTWKKGSLDTVKGLLSEARCSLIVGHVHRIERASKTIYGRRGPVPYMACCPGTIARIPGPVPKATERVNWQNGLAVVDYECGNGQFQVYPIEIYDGSCIYNGKKYEGQFDVKELKDDTSWDFF